MNPIYLFSYHKAGTQLLKKSFRNICQEFGRKFVDIYGKCDHIHNDADVLLFAHSLVDVDSIGTPYVGAHFIRDPRDVIVSGYLYHKRCDEPWCINTDFDQNEPILFPRVPYSQQHRAEDWKKQYLIALGNKSYQQNLIERDVSSGLLFEMHHYGGWTTDSMLSWDYNNPRITEVRFRRS